MRTKTWAYAIGAFFGGVAGAYYASFKSGAFPADFYFNFSVFLLCMVILGGMGSVWGVIARRPHPLVPRPGGAGHDRLQGPGRRARLRPDEVPVRDLRRHHRADDALPARRPDPRAPAQDRDRGGRARHAVLRRPDRGHPHRPRPERRLMATVDNLVEVTTLRKEFGGLVAIDDVDFTIARGSIVALIGPNGAGKTTFFNQITGVYKPTSGSIRVRRGRGRRPAAARDHGARHRPHVPEHPAVRADDRGRERARRDALPAAQRHHRLDPPHAGA